MPRGECSAIVAANKQIKKRVPPHGSEGELAELTVEPKFVPGDAATNFGRLMRFRDGASVSDAFGELEQLQPHRTIRDTRIGAHQPDGMGRLKQVEFGLEGRRMRLRPVAIGYPVPLAVRV